jgi:hypothetical protein
MKTTFYPFLRQKTLIFSCILVSTLLTAFPARANWTAEGRQVSWHMQVPSDWFGGSYAQIRRVMELNPESRHLLPSFLADVRNCDAALWHWPDLESLANNPSSFSTSTRTTIRISFNAGFGPIDNRTEAEISHLFQAYATGLRRGVSTGESVTLLETAAFLVGGRNAHEATFHFAVPNQGGHYEVVVLVLPPDGSMHIFELDMDSTRFPERRNEFHSMLRTLRYSN